MDCMDQIKGFEGNLQDLQESEQFVVSIVRIPLFDKRIDAIIFKYNFDSEFSLLSENVSVLRNSYDVITTNEKFKKLIRMVLDIGNFLNYKTSKGNSYGFKLDSLKDMSGLKSKKVEGKNYSLLDFVIINLRENAPEMLDFSKSFAPLEDAVKVDIDVIGVKFQELEKFVKNLHQDLESAKSYIHSLKESEEELVNGMPKEEVIEGCESFIDSFGKFHQEADESLKELDEDFKEVKTNLVKEGRKYGEDEDVAPIVVIKSKL